MNKLSEISFQDISTGRRGITKQSYGGLNKSIQTNNHDEHGGGEAKIRKINPRDDADFMDPIQVLPLIPSEMIESNASKPSSDKGRNYIHDIQVIESVITNDAPTVPLLRQSKENPYWAGHVRLLKNPTLSGDQPIAKFLLLEAFDGVPHPFRGIKPMAQRLQVKCATRDQDDDAVAVYEGEARLKWWSETPSGLDFTVILDPGPDSGYDHHPFKHYKYDKDHGDDFVIAVWLIGDDEAIEDRICAKKSFISLPPAQQAQILCSNDVSFQEWILREGRRLGIGRDMDETIINAAARIIRDICGVESRRQLNIDDLAAAKWRDIYRRYRQFG